MKDTIRKIELSQGYYALVDASDYEELNKYKWSAKKCDKNYYVYREKYLGIEKGKQKSLPIYMHRYLMGLKKGDKRQVDHINHNTLDNRRCNIRIVTLSQNHMNRIKHKGHTSIYKGVHYFPRDNNWRAQIKGANRPIHIGYYKTQKEAAKAYDKEAKKYFGEYAKLNFE